MSVEGSFTPGPADTYQITITPDPLHPGLYKAAGSTLTPDPYDPGLYMLQSAPPTPPGVDLNVTGLAALSTTVTVTRFWEGRSVVVRGVSRVPVTGADMFFQDLEAPIGVPITYRVSEYNAAGTNTVTRVSPPITITSDRPWISDPLDPGTVIAPRFGQGTLASLTRDRPGDVTRIQLSATSVAGVGLRGDPDGMPMSLIFLGQAELTALTTLLDQADPFLLRTPPGWPGRRLMYLTTPRYEQVTLSRPPLLEGMLTFTAQMVVPPAADVVKPQRTYGSVMIGQSYAATTTTWATYLAARRGY